MFKLNNFKLKEILLYFNTLYTKGTKLASCIHATS